jgi:hypothetical protein
MTGGMALSRDRAGRAVDEARPADEATRSEPDNYSGNRNLKLKAEARRQRAPARELVRPSVRHHQHDKHTGTWRPRARR